MSNKNKKGSSRKSHGSNRGLHVKVKTARGRKNSSTKWLERQLNDPYVALAKKEGYRSRAAYKLIEIDEKFDILKPGKSVVDLGAAPGGWTQVAASNVKGAKIVGIDLLEMEPIADATLLQHDFTADDAVEVLENAIGSKKVDIVLSDMAAASCGHAPTDHLRIVYLLELAFDFAKSFLNKDGVFVAKILRGGTENDLLNDMKKSFKTVKHFKPESSRKDSSEMYVVAMGFRD